MLSGSSDQGIITDKQIEASIQDLKNEAMDVLEATKGLAAETKEKLRGSLESELDEVTSEMRDLKKKARKASGREKRALKSRLAKLEKKEEALKNKLKKLGYTDTSFWVKIKERYRKAADGLKSVWNSLAGFFRGNKKSLNITL